MKIRHVLHMYDVTSPDNYVTLQLQLRPRWKRILLVPWIAREIGWKWAILQVLA